jgi:hypothetical protein
MNDIRQRTSLLLGDAPMPSFQRKRVGQDVIYAPKFWYWFRSNFNVIAILALVSAVTIPWILNIINGTEHRFNIFLLFGSILSLVGSIFVITSFYHISYWQRHPSSLILWRNISDLMFASLVIFDILRLRLNFKLNGICTVTVFFVQIFLLSGKF